MRYPIGVAAELDYLHDPQQQAPAGWCPNCGAEIWAEGKDLCARCERRGTVPMVRNQTRTFTVTASAPMLRAVREFMQGKNLRFTEA